MRQVPLLFGNKVYILPPNWREGQTKYEMFALQNNGGVPFKEFDTIKDALKFVQDRGLEVVGTSRPKEF
jgi:hypothetical protein